MAKVSENLYAETRFDWANVGAAVTEAGVVMIDSPVRPSDSKVWQEELRALSPKGIRFLIATDYHGDHTTGAAFVEDVQFIAPQYAYEEIVKGTNAFSKEIFVNTLRDLGHTEEADQITNTPVPPPRFCFEETMTLHLPPLTFELRRKGGHSPACSTVWVPEREVLFSSDVVINGPSAGMRDANMAEWIDALAWIESLPVKTIVPGHGDICGKEVATRLRERLAAIRGTMEDLVKAGKGREEAIADKAFEKFMHLDASRGEYWLQQRRETFRAGLERVYDEVAAADTNDMPISLD